MHGSYFKLANYLFSYFPISFFKFKITYNILLFKLAVY